MSDEFDRAGMLDSLFMVRVGGSEVGIYASSPALSSAVSSSTSPEFTLLLQTAP
jgi:hypothetical protein